MCFLLFDLKPFNENSLRKAQTFLSAETHQPPETGPTASSSFSKKDPAFLITDAPMIPAGKNACWMPFYTFTTAACLFPKQDTIMQNPDARTEPALQSGSNPPSIPWTPPIRLSVRADRHNRKKQQCTNKPTAAFLIFRKENLWK